MTLVTLSQYIMPNLALLTRWRGHGPPMCHNGHTVLFEWRRLVSLKKYTGDKMWHVNTAWMNALHKCLLPIGFGDAR